MAHFGWPQAINNLLQGQGQVQGHWGSPMGKQMNLITFVFFHLEDSKGTECLKKFLSSPHQLDV